MCAREKEEIIKSRIFWGGNSLEFKVHKRESPKKHDYGKEDVDIAYDFAKKAYKEFGDFLKGIVLFGTTAKKTYKTSGDIDILIVVDDISMILTTDVVEAYRIITEKIISQISKKIHVTTMRFTSFWEYMRAGDPIAINILREGVALVDTGFFEPLQRLLYQGRIRPTYESIYTYFSRAPITLNNSKWHLLQATIDLYWGVIDSAHAVLMRLGEIPPTPAHVASMLEEKLVKQGHLEKKYAKIMNNFYKLMKMITHREIKEISGPEFDKYYGQAEDFINRMEKFIDKKHVEDVKKK